MTATGSRWRRRAVPAALVAAALVAGIVWRSELTAWFTGERATSSERPSAIVPAPKPAGSAAAAPEEPALARVELPAAALASARKAFDATERIRGELAFDRLDAVAAPAREAAQALRAAQPETAPASAEVARALGEGVAAAEAIATAADLARARVAYGELNRILVAVATADPRLQDGWHVFRCPMAAPYGKWIQRSATLENPYMGRSMPTCGSAASWGAAAPAAPGDADLSHEGHGHEGDDISYYTCSMHPAVRQDGPGKCPICSMDLTPVTFDEAESGVIFIDEGRRGAIGIRTGRVVRAPLARTIRAVGRITYDESRLEDVTLKLSGYIAKLYVNATGQPVKRGQVLFTLYSPELYAAQQEYLLARQRASGDDSLARAAETKLRLWGISAAQLAAIARSGEPMRDVPFHAPAAGYVIEKDVVEGAAVEAGQRLYRIASLDRVWVEASLYEADLSSIRAGQAATVELTYLPGRRFDGKVTYVYPYLDPASRTGKVRLELRNAGADLKPDMYAAVTFAIDLGARLQIPITAVVYTGPRRLVFVDLGAGRLRPQEVLLGARTDDTVEVLGGLGEGQTIVISGNFLVAAESRIRSAAKFWSEERAGGAALDGGTE